MISLCMGVLAGIAVIVIGIVSRLADKPDRPEASRQGLGLALNIASLATAFMFGLTVTIWGVWELVSSVMGIAMLSFAPLTWVFWVASGFADLGCGLTLIAFGLLAIGILTMSPERKISLAKVRPRIALVALAVGPLQIILSIAYFLF